MSQSSIGLLYKIHIEIDRMCSIEFYRNHVPKFYRTLQKIPIEVDRMCSIEFYRNHVPKFYRTLIEVDRIFSIEFYRVFFVGRDWLWYPGLSPVLVSIALPFPFHFSMFSIHSSSPAIGFHSSIFYGGGIFTPPPALPYSRLGA